MSDAISVVHANTAEYESAVSGRISSFRCHAPVYGSRTTGNHPPVPVPRRWASGGDAAAFVRATVNPNRFIARDGTLP